MHLYRLIQIPHKSSDRSAESGRFSNWSQNKIVFKLVFLIGCVVDIPERPRNNNRKQEAISRRLQLPIFLSRRFHRPIYFQFQSRSDPHRNLTNCNPAQARTNVDMPTLFHIPVTKNGIMDFSQLDLSLI